MKHSSSRDRAAGAVPARSSLARAVAWAKESLLARGFALLLGLCVLAIIGGSAAARGSAAPVITPDVASPVGTANAASPPAPAVLADAGATPATRAGPPAAPARNDAEGENASAAPGRPLIEPEPTTAPRGGSSSSAPPRATPDDPVDLNTARVEDLRRLPGIGAKRADAVLALRARLPGGRFRQLEDLLKVKGVGRAMIKRWHPLVRIDGERR